MLVVWPNCEAILGRRCRTRVTLQVARRKRPAATAPPGAPGDDENIDKRGEEPKRHRRLPQPKTGVDRPARVAVDEFHVDPVYEQGMAAKALQRPQDGPRRRRQRLNPIEA